MNEFHEEDEEYFCRFTFGQFVSLALLEVVALFFVFYLGARYGTTILGREDQPAADRSAATLRRRPARPPATAPRQTEAPRRTPAAH